MTIESLANVLNFCGVGATDNDLIQMVSLLHTNVEKWVKRYCNREFESTTYYETYDGNGHEVLFLNQYPVSSILNVAVGKISVIRVACTNSSCVASISVNSTGIILYKDRISDSAITFSEYATLGDVVDAINAITDWRAILQGGSYSSYSSLELKPAHGLNCTNNVYADLYIPDRRNSVEFEVYLDEGYLYNPSRWPIGNKNIFVDYVAGYSSANMPDDLKLAVKILVKHWYQRLREESFGLRSYSIGGISMSFDEEGTPVQALRILKSYRKVNI